MPRVIEAAAPGASCSADIVEDDSDHEEWVANDNGGFELSKRASYAEPPPPIKTPRRRFKPSPAILIVIIAIVLAIISRTNLFWCGARGIPLGTLFRFSGYSLNAIPDLSGQTALVTGANTGLGLEVARQLARKNANLVLACRDLSKCDDAAASIHQFGRPRPRTVQLDLGDLKSVAKAATQLQKQIDRLDMLILNAGVAAQFPISKTRDGIERTFQMNYLGHFALTTKLKPLLQRTAKARKRRVRIVHLTSGAHRGAPIEGVPLHLDRINGEMGPYARYGMAKLASLVFSNELSRRWGSFAISNAVHPGVVATQMLRSENFAAMIGPIGGRLAWLVAKARNLLFAYSARTAAVSVLYAAVGAGETTGQLIVPVATLWPPHHAKATDEAFARRLWEFSEALSRA